MGKTRFSRWNLLCAATLAGLGVTTFQPVIQATIVHPSIGGSIFDITGYVSDLTDLYAPWLALMMSPGSGQRTADLLTIGTGALHALCAIAIAAVVLAAISIAANAFGKRKAGRILGILGYALAFVVPLAAIAIVAIVQMEMSSDIISIAVLDVRPVCYAQMAIAVAGIGATLLSTHRIADPKQPARG